MFAVQFLIPYALGLAGLILVGLLDLIIYLALRRRARVRKRPRRYPHVEFGPVDRRYVVRRKKGTAEEEVAAGFLLATFAVLVYVIGFAVRVEYWWVSPDVVLYILGSAMTTAALYIVRMFLTESVPSESDLFDTTEDH